MLSSIAIEGLRGYANKQTLSLAQPDGNPGSGLTIIVGANNAGKSTTIEAFRALTQHEAPSFTQGRRNQSAGDRVEISVKNSTGKSLNLRSIRPGSSETVFEREDGGPSLTRALVLPSRRVFDPYFGRGLTTRDEYMIHVGFPAQRTATVNQFSYRLFALESRRDKFNELLKKLLDPVPDWSIDQMDQGQYFLKIRKEGVAHSSEGMGEGLISLFFIVDALHDSSEGDLIVIDEPELTLHPALQRKLAKVLLEFSSTRQMVIATHSPYFVPIDALAHGAVIARAYNTKNSSKLAQLSRATSVKLGTLVNNINNPNIVGLNAQEVFFMEENIILLEGQEDVVLFPKISNSLLPDMRGSYYGWGVGGAENMRIIAQTLCELGFKKIAGILDGNKTHLACDLGKQFPDYIFRALPAVDIRSKKAQPARPEIEGLLMHDNASVKEQYKNATLDVLKTVDDYFRASSSELANGPCLGS